MARARSRTLFALLLTSAGAVNAELAAITPTTFVSTFRQEVEINPSRAIEAVGRIGDWWNPSHSYSGQAQNLQLTLKAGGCFCESWDGNSVEHARVLLVLRDKLVRLEGALGPLQPLAVHGILTFTADAKDSVTTLSLTYRVSGSSDAGLDKIAPAVDRVVGEQFQRWTAHAQRP